MNKLIAAAGRFAVVKREIPDTGAFAGGNPSAQRHLVRGYVTGNFTRTVVFTVYDNKKPWLNFVTKDEALVKFKNLTGWGIEKIDRRGAVEATKKRYAS